MSTRKVTKTFTLGLPNGKEVEFEATATLVRYLYGADADGNRGEMREDVDDIAIDPKEEARVKEAIFESLAESDWE
jgi:hypothetical protein